jgi:hypothetical protein
MRRRIERASRQPPPPRRAAEADAAAPVPEVAAEVPTATIAAGDGGEATPPPRRARSRAASRMRLSADLPPVNLAIRVRKPLDDRLADVIHQLRRDGVRTSKVELIEMLLWEMPDDQLSAVRERLRQFRDWAPRGTGAPLEAEGS